MGNSSSTNVAKILTNISTDQSSTIISDQNTSAITTNNINCSGVKGSVNESDNVQDAEGSLSMKGIQKSVVNLQAQQSIIQNLSQASSAITSGVNLFQNSDSSNILNATMNVGLTMTSSTTQKCLASNTVQNVLTCKEVGGDAYVLRNQQKAVSKTVADCVSDNTNISSAIQSVQQTVDQVSTAKSEGLSLTALFMVIAAIIIGLLIVVVGGAAFAISEVMSYIAFFICAALLITAIIYTLKYNKEDHVLMNPVGFSPLIKDNGLCSGATAYTPSQTFLRGDEAWLACKGDDKCKGIDWIPSSTNANWVPGTSCGKSNVSGNQSLPSNVTLTSQPQTIFYSSLPNTCTFDNFNNTQLNQCCFANDATFRPGVCSSNGCDDTKGNNQDVTINTSDGTVWWKPSSLSDDPSKTVSWINLGTAPGFTVGKSILSTAIGPKAPYNVDGTYYIDTTDPLNWKYYSRDNTNVPWTQISPQPFIISTPPVGIDVTAFPGRSTAAPQANQYTWSAFKKQLHGTDFYIMISTWIGFVLSLIIGIILYVKSGKNKNNETASSSSSSSSSSLSSSK